MKVNYKLVKQFLSTVEKIHISRRYQGIIPSFSMSYNPDTERITERLHLDNLVIKEISYPLSEADFEETTN